MTDDISSELAALPGYSFVFSCVPHTVVI